MKDGPARHALLTVETDFIAAWRRPSMRWPRALRTWLSGFVVSTPVIDERVASDDLRDLEDDDEADDSSDEAPVPVDREAVAGELALVESFVARAKSLPDDAKARSFQDAIRVILDLGRDGRPRQRPACWPLSAFAR